MTLLQSKNHVRLLAVIGVAFCALMTTTVATAADWVAKKAPLSETISGICFPTPNLGFFVTSGGKYGVTRDGGNAWQVYVISDQAVFEDVYFRTKDTGLAVGRRGQIYRTIDGGRQWEDRHIKEDSITWLTSAIFLTDSIALATGLRPGTNLEGVLYRSTDGGAHWTRVAITGMGFGELFAAPGIPVCFQSFGRLNYSLDKGITWQSLATVSGKPGRATVFFNNTGIICGNDAMCAFSRDRGKTWTTVPLEGGAALTSTVLVDDSLGYVAGTGGFVLTTNDGGKTWKKDTPLPATVDIADLAINGTKLFAVGADGFIFSKPIERENAPAKTSKK